MRQSNVGLHPDEVKFCRDTVRPLGYGGYFHINWAGSAGSGRKFYRLTLNSHATMIFMLWHGTDSDWDYFLAMDELRKTGNLTMLPEVKAHDREKGMIVIEDGGDRQLRDLMFTGIDSRKKVIVMNSVIDELVKWQNCSVPTDSLIASRALDKEQFIWETSYFAKHLTALMPQLAELFDETWEAEREELATICDALPRTLLHRDFQSENIVVRNQRVSFVDFQGSRMGPPEYDFASLLFDPYLYPILTEEIRESILVHYESSGERNRKNIALCGTQRLMQALGAYGNLSLNRGKKQYKKFVWPALQNLSIVLESHDRFPQMKIIVDKAIESWKK